MGGHVSNKIYLGKKKYYEAILTQSVHLIFMLSATIQIFYFYNTQGYKSYSNSAAKTVVW